MKDKASLIKHRIIVYRRDQAVAIIISINGITLILTTPSAASGINVFIDVVIDFVVVFMNNINLHTWPMFSWWPHILTYSKPSQGYILSMV